jgi:hypothetical protein
MHKQKRLEMLELANSKICTARCLHTFSSCDTDSNMRLEDHAHIVGTITNSKRCFIRMSFSD